jgi:predicted SnoaL-like aldol condensation-catalyzing enzyme
LVWKLAAADMNDLKVLRQTADELFAVDYKQHNPLVTDLQGREGFVDAMKRLVQQGIAARYPEPMLVLANCNYASAMILFKRPDGDKPGATYNSYWFDIWRIENGKFVEHWDQAIKGQDYDWDVVLPLNAKGK